MKTPKLQLVYLRRVGKSSGIITSEKTKDSF